MQAFEQSWLSTIIRESVWLYPTIETFHLLGIATLFGSILLLDLRLIGLGRDLHPQQLFRRAIPVTLLGFLLAAATGFLLFAAQPATLIASRLFLLKICLIFLLGINAAALHAAIKPHGAGYTDSRATFSFTVRLQAVLSIIGWAAVIAMGRWLAYF